MLEGFSASSDVTECINSIFPQSQLSKKIVNLLLAITNQNDKLTILWGADLIKPSNLYIVRDEVADGSYCRPCERNTCCGWIVLRLRNNFHARRKGERSVFAHAG